MPPLVKNSNSAGGDTSLETKCFNLVAPFKTSAAVTAKRVVSIGTDGKVATSATDGTASLCIGISTGSNVASGDTARVVVAGLAENVPCSGTVARGDLLKRNTTTAGYVQATATPAAGEVIGVAINASASNVVDVWVTALGKSLS